MSRIVIIGLGPGSPRQLTVEAELALLKGGPLYLRTGRHPLARYLSRRGIQFRTFDPIYQRARDFSQVYRVVARRLIRAALCCGTVCYAVPGHPMAGEAAVRLLKRVAPRYGIKIEIISGLSFLEPALGALGLDLLEGVTVLDALALDNFKEPHRQHLLLAQVYSRAVASRVKLKLLELYPPEYSVKIVHKAGYPEESVKTIRLYALDRYLFDHDTVVYLPPAGGYSLGDLLMIMSRLRSADGCPWDKQQTHRSLRQYLVEEAYEVIAAIDQENDISLAEELGDVLLQIVFHCRIAEEQGHFDLNRVIDGICNKLLRRHPHVFGQGSARSISQVKVLWEQIKREEKGHLPGFRIPDGGLPALLGAYKVQKLAAEMGFDWPTIEGAWDKLTEETAELKDAYKQGFSDKIEEEFGDLLFAAVNVARFLKVNPEMALGKALRKFVSRFEYILEQVNKNGKPVTHYTLDELDHWWEEAKDKGKN
jgi:tetrapyrrole methylase family protein / MazG family protein